jgi:ABC-2 type transport system permease protein
MEQFTSIFKRELLAYFRTPVAYVFLVIFLVASGVCTFFIGNFFDSNHAGLDLFFTFHPWLYLFLVPAIGMRLWAEDRRSGAIELLFSLPITVGEAVLAKFAAAWLFIGIALVLTFPLFLTVNYLGKPDNMVMMSGYLGSFLMAGAYLAITNLTSALSKNQVVSFIISCVICLVLVFMGWGVFSRILSDYLPVGVVDFIVSLGFVGHFETLSRGLINFGDLLYFLSVISVALTATGIVLNRIKTA